MFKQISKLQYEDVRKQIGHYRKVDYHPEMRPAGTVVLTEAIEDCFKDYKLQDGVEALKSTTLGWDKNDSREPSKYSSRIVSANSGLYGGYVKSCLEMYKQSPFQLLITELRDTATNSYWKKEIGKMPDQTPNLPDGMDPILTTFGKITISNETAAELINPRKTATEVITDSLIGHALYKKTHNDYYPSEQVNRENHQYGKKLKIDKQGGKVKRSMKWFNQDVATVVGNQQANFLDDTQSRLGHTVVRANMAPPLEDRTFGKISKHDLYGVGELLKNSTLSSDKSVQKQYLEHINMLRLHLKKHALSFTDLYQIFVHYDINKSQNITLEESYRILETFQIRPNKNLFELLLNSLNLIKDGKVSYKDIINILSWKCEFPLLPKISDVLLEHDNYQSMYKKTICDPHLQKNNHSYAAGLGTERVDVSYAVVPPGEPRCERENLGDQTSVAAILSPNIFTQNGLSHLDFFKIRKAHELRELFEDIGINFPGDSFNVIWNEGLKKDCTGGVCIETFRSELDRLAAATYEEIPVM